MPLPPGYTLDQSDQSASGLPPGYTLDQPGAQNDQPSIMQNVWNQIKQTPAMMGQEAIGALKGAGQTAYNLADMTQRAATFGMGPKLPPSPVPPPVGPAQQVGHAAERVGEYFIPGGAVNEGAKAIEGAVQGVRGARALAGAGRAALEGVSAGGVN